DHSLVRKSASLYGTDAFDRGRAGGFLALDQQISNFLYQVIWTPHGEKRSALITANAAFSWGNTLFNTAIATVIVEWLYRKILKYCCSSSTQPAMWNRSWLLGMLASFWPCMVSPNPTRPHQANTTAPTQQRR